MRQSSAVGATPLSGLHAPGGAAAPPRPGGALRVALAARGRAAEGRGLRASTSDESESSEEDAGSADPPCRCCCCCCPARGTTAGLTAGGGGIAPTAARDPALLPWGLFCCAAPARAEGLSADIVPLAALPLDTDRAGDEPREDCDCDCESLGALAGRPPLPPPREAPRCCARAADAAATALAAAALGCPLPPPPRRALSSAPLTEGLRTPARSPSPPLASEGRPRRLLSWAMRSARRARGLSPPPRPGLPPPLLALLLLPGRSSAAAASASARAVALLATTSCARRDASAA